MTLPAITLSQWQVSPVNRKEQRDEFSSALERIRVLGSVFQTIYEWFGSPGIGKSTLLRLLIEDCHNANASYAFINFKDKSYPQAETSFEKGEVDATRLIEDLINGLSDADSLKVKQAIKTYRSIPADEKERANKQLKHSDVARAFVRFVGDVSKHDPVVMLFDETESADPELVAWLEEWIVNPLIQNGRCLIVWAGRRPQRWKRFEVRRRLRSQELGLFDAKGTVELFESNSKYPLTELSDPVRRLTLGHPFADVVALRRLDTLAKEGRIPQRDQFSSIETDLIDGLVQDFVEKYAFKGLSKELANSCRILALVRQFDVILLREILTDALPSSYDNYKREEFGGLLSRLRATQLVWWDDRRKGYALDLTLRHILGENIRRHQPKVYAKVNQVAIGVYRDWIERAGDNRGIYIVEELYQQACLNLISEEDHPLKKTPLPVLLEQRLREYPQRDPDLRASALDRLYHELEDDPDLPRLISYRGRDELLSIVRTARVKVFSDSN